MPFDGAAADEQSCAYFRIGQSFTDQADDLSLLGSELVGRVDVAFTGGLATDGQFAGGALGESLRAHIAEHFVGGAQLLAALYPAVRAAQPFAVEQVGASELPRMRVRPSRSIASRYAA